TCDLRLRIVVQSLARARFSNDEQGFKRPAIACLDVQFRERLAKLVVRQAACSEQVADQGAGGGKCGNPPLYGAKKDAASHVRRQRVGHRGCRKTALANTWFAQQGHGAAFAARARETFAKRFKLVRAPDNRILIAASDVVAIHVSWPGIQPVDFAEAIRASRNLLVQREFKGRPAQFGGLGGKADLAGRCFLLQLGGDMYRRAGHVKAVDRVATALAQADQTRMNPDAKIDRMSAGSGRSAMTLDIPGCDTGAIRMIFIGGWPAKDGDAAVARIMDDLSSGAFHRTADVNQPTVQKRLRLVRVASGDMARRTHHIDGEDRDDVALRGCGAATGHLLPRLLHSECRLARETDVPPSASPPATSGHKPK